MTGQIVILCTCSSADEADRIAHLLVERRLAACVNVLPAIQSVYRWKEQIESGSEWLLLIKTSENLFSQVDQLVQAAHSYEVPELIALPIAEGSTNYLNWLRSSVLPQADIQL